MNRKQFVAVLAVLAIGLGSLPAFADESESHGDPAAKLARGLVNTATGWMEVPKEIARGAEAGGVARLLAGLVTGLIHGVIRTGTGAYEAGTFLLPIHDGYRPVIEPASVFETQ